MGMKSEVSVDTKTFENGGFFITHVYADGLEILQFGDTCREKARQFARRAEEVAEKAYQAGYRRGVENTQADIREALGIPRGEA